MKAGVFLIDAFVFANIWLAIKVLKVTGLRQLKDVLTEVDGRRDKAVDAVVAVAGEHVGLEPLALAVTAGCECAAAISIITEMVSERKSVVNWRLHLPGKPFQLAVLVEETIVQVEGGGIDPIGVRTRRRALRAIVQAVGLASRAEVALEVALWIVVIAAGQISRIQGSAGIGDWAGVDKGDCAGDGGENGCEQHCLAGLFSVCRGLLSTVELFGRLLKETRRLRNWKRGEGFITKNSSQITNRSVRRDESLIGDLNEWQA